MTWTAGALRAGALGLRQVGAETVPLRVAAVRISGTDQVAAGLVLTAWRAVGDAAASVAWTAGTGRAGAKGLGARGALPVPLHVTAVWIDRADRGTACGVLAARRSVGHAAGAASGSAQKRGRARPPVRKQLQEVAGGMAVLAAANVAGVLRGYPLVTELDPEVFLSGGVPELTPSIVNAAELGIG